MAIITGGILGAVFVAGIGAGLAAKDTNETEEETDDLDPVDESLSGGDEEVDELMDAPEDEDEDDSVEE